MNNYQGDLEQLRLPPDQDFRREVQKAHDYAMSLEQEMMLAKVIDTVEDRTLLYNSVLKIDQQLKTMVIMKSNETLNPALFKKMEAILA